MRTLTPEQRRRNRQTAIGLALIVLVFFCGVIARKLWLG